MRRLWILLFSCFYLAFGQVLEPRYDFLPANKTLESELLNASNQARQANGVAALQFDELLALAARHHAQEMASLNYFSHQSPDPASASPADRVANAGSSLVLIGENIAKMPGEDIAGATTEGWMNSPGHRQNLLEPIYTHVGFGTAKDSQGYTYVVQVFAYQPFQLVKADIVSRQGKAYQLVFNAKTSAATTAIFSYGTEQSEPISLLAGDNPIALKTFATGKIHLDASVQAGTGGGYIIQDGGWIDLDKGSYQADAYTEKYALELQGFSVYPEDLVLSDISLYFDGALGKELAVFVNDSYQTRGLESGILRLSLPQAEPATIAIGEVIEGNQVRIIHQLQLDASQGIGRLIAVAFH